MTLQNVFEIKMKYFLSLGTGIYDKKYRAVALSSFDEKAEHLVAVPYDLKTVCVLGQDMVNLFLNSLLFLLILTILGNDHRIVTILWIGSPIYSTEECNTWLI